MNEYDKNYFEKYAMLSLIYCYDENLSIMYNPKKTSERPDWQSDVLDIGIEVVRAISKTEGEENYIINRYFNKGLGGYLIQKIVSKKFPKYKNLIKVHNNVAYTTKGWFDFDEKCREIENEIMNKICKLNGNYTIYENNWLYVFTSTGLLSEYDIKIIINKLKERYITFNICYDKIFINAIDKLFCINNLSSFDKIDIPNEILKKLKQEAMKEVEK